MLSEPGPARIVCPISENPRSERALPSAIDAARLCGAKLTIFRAVEDPHMIARAEAELAELVAGISVDGSVPEVCVVANPHAPQAIATEARSAQSMVVMATSSQPFLHAGYLGSAAEFVMQRAFNPVLLIGPRNRTQLRDVHQVVATCDGSALSETVLPDADEWRQRLDVPMWVITSLPPSTNSGITECNYVRSLAEPLGAQWDVVHGSDAAHTITNWSDNALVCATTHGRSGIRRFTIGSVVAGITRRATGPVLVRRPPTNT